MEKVEGEAPLPWVPGGGAAFDDATRAALGEQFVAGLARLHSFQWRGTPAEQLDGARDVSQAAGAQIDFWERYLRRHARRPYPILEWGLLWLRANSPRAPRISIIHGDYRIGNFLVLDGRISAMLDWELVHLGDPHQDLGLDVHAGVSRPLAPDVSSGRARRALPALPGVERNRG